MIGPRLRMWIEQVHLPVLESACDGDEVWIMIMDEFRGSPQLAVGSCSAFDRAVLARWSYLPYPVSSPCALLLVNMRCCSRHLRDIAFKSLMPTLLFCTPRLGEVSLTASSLIQSLCSNAILLQALLLAVRHHLQLENPTEARTHFTPLHPRKSATQRPNPDQPRSPYCLHPFLRHHPSSS